MSRHAQNKKVYLGMSGGVDSSVSAILLKQAGYDVTGVFIRVWQPEGGECTWKDERRDAMRVAAHLDIPFITLDLRDAYKKGVVDYMISEYKIGRTPNPDVMCNREVKFGAFWDWAKTQGADYIATGHYAQIKNSEMCEGADSAKDQSYFLWTLRKEELEHVLFPVGHLQKAGVRRIAAKYAIPVFDKKDSQGVCFIGHIDMKEFLKGYIETHAGDVLDTAGNVVGTHEGALLYTIGERHGFAIFKQKTNQKRLYIVAKDIDRNTITVSDEVSAEDTNVRTEKPNTQIHVTHVVLRTDIEKLKHLECRTRYRQKRIPIQEARKTDSGVTGTELTVVLTENQLVSSGQSIVLYDGEVCVGGGVIN